MREEGVADLDSTSRVLLDRIQRSFPLVSRPYEALAVGLGLSEAEVRERIGLLKEHRQIRQISAIFNTGALGYRSSLVAMAVDQEQLDHAARVVNAYPGVSHNYLRPGRYNMWYTIAVPPGGELEHTVDALSRAAGDWPTLILPALRKYKLAVVLDVLEEGESDAAFDQPGRPMTEAREPFQATPDNLRMVRCIQEDLPLVEQPFAQWAHTLDLPEAALLERIAKWLHLGFIRRFAAVLNHRQVGFNANGMVVWACPEAHIDEYGIILSSHAEVSHCYHRPAHPEWPFNLYAMIHGRTVEDCHEMAQRLAEAIHLPDHLILFSTREFKKIRLKLFWEDPIKQESVGVDVGAPTGQMEPMSTTP
jgi:siroheme decarboxylase